MTINLDHYSGISSLWIGDTSIDRQRKGRRDRGVSMSRVSIKLSLTFHKEKINKNEGPMTLKKYTNFKTEDTHSMNENVLKPSIQHFSTDCKSVSLQNGYKKTWSHPLNFWFDVKSKRKQSSSTFQRKTYHVTHHDRHCSPRTSTRPWPHCPSQVPFVIATERYWLQVVIVRRPE